MLQSVVIHTVHFHIQLTVTVSCAACSSQIWSVVSHVALGQLKDKSKVRGDF